MNKNRPRAIFLMNEAGRQRTYNVHCIAQTFDSAVRSAPSFLRRWLQQAEIIFFINSYHSIIIIILDYLYTPTIEDIRQQAAQWQLERALLVMKMAYNVFENSSAVAARALLVTEVASSASNLFILVL